MIYFLIGAISLAFTVILLLGGDWFLALWSGPFGITMIVGGIWLSRAAKESK